MNVVFLCEFLGQGSFETVQVAHAELDDFGAGGVAEEEGHFGVFVQLGCFFVEGALAAGVFGFAVRGKLARCVLGRSSDKDCAHLSQHHDCGWSCDVYGVE